MPSEIPKADWVQDGCQIWQPSVYIRLYICIYLCVYGMCFIYECWMYVCWYVCVHMCVCMYWMFFSLGIHLLYSYTHVYITTYEYIMHAHASILHTKI